MKDRAQRVLVVAARPEDEAKVFGATIATLVQRGTELIVLACSNSSLSAEIDAQAREVLGISAHHILRNDDGHQFSTLPAQHLAVDLADAITALKPDVVVSYAKIDSGSNSEHEARLVHEATAHATAHTSVPFYTTSSVPVDRGVAVSSATAIAFKRRARELYEGEVAAGESVPTPLEYVSRLRRGELVIGERSRLERVLLAIVAAVVGALVGLVLTAIHQSTVTIFGVRVPWGVVAAVALTTALILGLRLLYDTRIAPGFASLGVLSMSALLAASMPGGTILIPANVPGYVWTFAPVLIVLVVVGWPRVNRQASALSRDSIEPNSPVKGADNS